MSWNHRIVWAGRNLIDYLVPTPLPWAGTPAWPWTLPGSGHSQFLWATCSSHHPHGKEFLPYI